MRYNAYIEIEFDPNSINKISDILGVNANKHINGNWIYFISIDEDGDWVDFYDVFYNILKDKIQILDEELKINKDQINIWLVLEYEGQCNFEINPNDLAKLSSLEVTLCVSCYQGNLSKKVFS